MPEYPKHDAALTYMRALADEVYESPPHSNRGPIQHRNPTGGVDFFQEHDFVAGVGYPWCVSTWLTAWEVGANRRLPYRTAGAYAMLNWARGAGWARASKSCIPGDAIVFNVGSGHLAMLERWDGDYVHTIDGNHSDKVARAVRHKSLIAGGVHVPEDASKPDPPAPKPYWVIATSSNGKRVLLFSKFATEKQVLGLLPRLFLKYGRAGVTIKRSKPTGAR